MVAFALERKEDSTLLIPQYKEELLWCRRATSGATQSLVCVLDWEGRPALNEACEQATGFRRRELIGRDTQLVIPPGAEAFVSLEYILDSRRAGPAGRWLAEQPPRLARRVQQAIAGAAGMPSHLRHDGG